MLTKSSPTSPDTASKATRRQFMRTWPARVESAAPCTLTVGRYQRHRYRDRYEDTSCMSHGTREIGFMTFTEGFGMVIIPKRFAGYYRGIIPTGSMDMMYSGGVSYLP